MAKEDDLFQAKMNMLIEKVKEGKMLFPKEKGIEKLFLAIRRDAEGNIVPDSVDVAVLSIANIVFRNHMESEMRKISLKDVQKRYIEILEMYFSQPFAEMKKHKLTPADIAWEMSQKKSLVSTFSKGKFGSHIKEFWQYYGPIVEVHLEDMKCLKAVFGGDIFPSYKENIALKAGLYFDTIVLPDPLLRTALLPKTHFKPSLAVYYWAKHALNALQYKNLILADVTPPIVVVVPDIILLYPQEMDFLKKISFDDSLLHLEKIFKRSFASITNVDKFLKEKDSIEKLANEIKDQSRVLLDVEEKDASLVDKLKSMGQAKDDFLGEAVLTHAGQQLKMTTFGRMMQANDLLRRAEIYGGTPLIDAPTSWQYLLWKYEYDQARSKELAPEASNLLVAQTLMGEQMMGKIPILKNISEEAIIKLRKEGALQELRDIMRISVDKFQNVSEQEFAKASQEIIANLDSAFTAYKKKINNLSSSKKKFFGFDIAPWIVSGTIGIIATTVSNVPVGVLAAKVFGDLIGIRSGRELWAQGKAILDTEKQLKRTPAGIIINTTK